MYPDEFKKCIGEEEVVAGMSVGQQDHQMFGFSYQTIIGNDTKNTKYGYQIHVVYGCTAAASAKDYETVNDSPSAAEMSFDISTTPVDVTGFKPTATLLFDSTKLSKEQMKLSRLHCMVMNPQLLNCQLQHDRTCLKFQD